MTPVPPARIAIVSDFDEVGAGIARFLAPYATQVAVVATLAPGSLPAEPVDVVLCDLFGRAEIADSELDALASCDAVGAVAVYAFDPSDALVERARAAGARGIVSKAMPASALAAALVALAGGEDVVAPGTGVGRATREVRGWPGHELGLSEREAEVAVLAAVGHRNSEIAEALAVSIDTVKTHLARSFRKLGVHNRTALSALVHTHAAFRRLPVPARR